MKVQVKNISIHTLDMNLEYFVETVINLERNFLAVDYDLEKP